MNGIASFLVIACDCASIAAEVSSAEDMQPIAETLKNLYESGDSRARHAPVNFPVALNRDLLMIFVGAALYSLGMSSETTVWMLVSEVDGRIVTASVPDMITSIAPNFSLNPPQGEAPPEESG